VSHAHAGLSDNLSYASVPAEQIAVMARQVARARPQAIVCLCTNFPAAIMAAPMEAELGLPVYDSTALGVWHALRLCGVDAAPPRRSGARCSPRHCDGDGALLIRNAACAGARRCAARMARCGSGDRQGRIAAVGPASPQPGPARWRAASTPAACWRCRVSSTRTSTHPAT
jgi:hypothetical protein